MLLIGFRLAFEIGKLFGGKYFLKEWSRIIKIKNKRKSMIGWSMIHDKIKYEQIKEYIKQKRDNHFRYYIQLNRWWYNEDD